MPGHCPLASRNDTLHCVEEYYGRLHARPPPLPADAASFLDKIAPRVTPAMAAQLDAPLSVVSKAAHKLRLGKATGLDGLSPELYQCVLDFLKVVLHVWDKSCERSFLPRPFRTAAVSLIYKKGATDTLDKYRPISVLPTAYKIVTKALAMHLAGLMSVIVPPNQTGFINVKAYDTLSREFMLNVMRRLGFGATFLRAVFTLHNFTFAVFIVNNFHTRVVQLFSGVCQGCPLAPLLFAIATIAFIVAAALELPPLCIPGLVLEGSVCELLKLELLDSFYADDLTLFLANRAAFDKALDLLALCGEHQQDPGVPPV